MTVIKMDISFLTKDGGKEIFSEDNVPGFIKDIKKRVSDENISYELKKNGVLTLTVDQKTAHRISEILIKEYGGL